jgi:hypothetical protein
MRAEFSLDNDRYFLRRCRLKRRLQMKTICNDRRPQRQSCLQWIEAARGFCRAILGKKMGPMPRNNSNGVLLRWLDLPQIFVWAKDRSFNAPAAPA